MELEEGMGVTNDFQLVIIQTMASMNADQVRLLVEENVGRKLEDFALFLKENEVLSKH